MTHQTEAELMPCPFCGSEHVIMEQYKADGLRIICKNCAVKREQRTMRKSLDWLRAGMISDWNRRAPAAPVISEATVLAITTAYEQGVGKGHQSHARKEAITNPYSDEWGCDSAWQMGYDEGREQAERKAAAPQPPVAAPVQNPLTDEQVFECTTGTLSEQGHQLIHMSDPGYAAMCGTEQGARWVLSNVYPENSLAFARAIERAHGITQEKQG